MKNFIKGTLLATVSAITITGTAIAGTIDGAVMADNEFIVVLKNGTGSTANTTVFAMNDGHRWNRQGNFSFNVNGTSEQLRNCSVNIIAWGDGSRNQGMAGILKGNTGTVYTGSGQFKSGQSNIGASGPSDVPTATEINTMVNMPLINNPPQTFNGTVTGGTPPWSSHAFPPALMTGVNPANFKWVWPSTASADVKRKVYSVFRAPCSDLVKPKPKLDLSLNKRFRATSNPTIGWFDITVGGNGNVLPLGDKIRIHDFLPTNLTPINLPTGSPWNCSTFPTQPGLIECDYILGNFPPPTLSLQVDLSDAPKPVKNCAKVYAFNQNTHGGYTDVNSANNESCAMTPRVIIPPAIPMGDHFQCYMLEKGDRVKPETIYIKDQFGGSKAVLGKPIMLCNPSLKVHNRKEYPIRDKERHLVCYDYVEQEKVERQNLLINTQFGSDEVVSLRRKMFCAPAGKAHLDKSRGKPHVKPSPVRGSRSEKRIIQRR